MLYIFFSNGNIILVNPDGKTLTTALFYTPYAEVDLLLVTLRVLLHKLIQTSHVCNKRLKDSPKGFEEYVIPVNLADRIAVRKACDLIDLETEANAMSYTCVAIDAF